MQTSTATTTETHCGECGEPVATRHCPKCGAKNPRFTGSDPLPKKGGWADVADDILGADRQKMLGVIWSLIKAPVKTTLRLTEDESYTGHVKLMLTLVALSATFQAFFATKLLIGLFPNLIPATITQLTINEKNLRLMLAVAGPSILIMTFVQYYFFSWISKVNRTPRYYYKLCMISVAFGSVIQLAFCFLWIALSIVVGFYKIDGVMEFSLWTSIGSYVAVLFYIFGHHRKFWELGKLTMALVSSALLVVTILVQATMFIVFSHPIIRSLVGA
jgi:hypothetical protein